MRFHLFSALVGMTIVAFVRGQDVVHHADLAYGDEPRLKLDIVAPAKAETPRPCVIFLHGTGPLAKQRKFFVTHATEVARQGFVGVAIDYRHTPDVPYPGAGEDAEMAVGWLRRHADKYKLDPERIAAVGYSGGGALACWLGMKSKKPVQAVVAYFPPTDFAQLHREAGAGKIVFPTNLLLSAGLEKWLGGTPKTAAERYAQASPITHVDKDAAPLLLIHGTEDRVIPVEHSRRLFERIIAKKGRVSYLELTGAGHNFDEETSVNAQLAASATQAFLKGTLALKRE